MSEKIESLVVTCIEADKPTRNDRIYSKECMSKMVEMINEQASQGKMWVTNSLPEGPETPLHDICMNVKKASLEDDKIKIDVKYFKNPLLTEENIIGLLKSDKFQVIPRCTGSIDEKSVVTIDEVYGFSICAKDPDVPYNYKEPNDR